MANPRPTPKPGPGCDHYASSGENTACTGGDCSMGCGNAREHLLMMRPGAVSLYLLVIGCATAAGQAVLAERSESVLKPGEKAASSASPTMLEGFLKTQSSELLSGRRREDDPPSDQRAWPTGRPGRDRGRIFRLPPGVRKPRQSHAPGRPVTARDRSIATSSHADIKERRTHATGPPGPRFSEAAGGGEPALVSGTDRCPVTCPDGYVYSFPG